ncbi:hypothetical protein C8F04DRAFT_1180647 [Mycena alexandri]|uniref:Uncharacterized protein n=1 Tax=Mycena alexandri TaxID=1745969 RepID=A0AAD6X5E7_9AGAR|nr:hypothetical protein C8F04DRAFT_1180647 [Mycena alexandri]
MPVALHATKRGRTDFLDPCLLFVQKFGVAPGTRDASFRKISSHIHSPPKQSSHLWISTMIASGCFSVVHPPINSTSRWNQCSDSVGVKDLNIRYKKIISNYEVTFAQAYSISAKHPLDGVDFVSPENRPGGKADVSKRAPGGLNANTSLHDESGTTELSNQMKLKDTGDYGLMASTLHYSLWQQPNWRVDTGSTQNRGVCGCYREGRYRISIHLEKKKIFETWATTAISAPVQSSPSLKFKINQNFDILP